MADESGIPQLDALRELWTRLGTTQRLTLGGAAVVAVALVLGLVSFVNSTKYHTLYEGLDREDATRVLAQLKERKVDYRLADSGRSVLVPADQLDELRLGMSHPDSGSLGWGLFDRNQLGATRFTENINLTRAIQGELTTTIRRIPEVASARVHLVLPTERTFGLQKAEAKASVFLTMRPGRELATANVRGVQNLVAYAVEGMKPDAVVVIGGGGTLLSAGEEGSNRLSGDELNEKQRIEQELRDKIVQMLEPQYGAGRVLARVSADLDFSAIHQTEEIVDPDGRSMISEEQLEENGLAGGGSGGIPGVKSNVGPATSKADVYGPPTPSGQRTSARRNWEVSKTVRQVTQPRYRLQRLSVAVAIDANALPEGTTAEMAPISELIRATVGFDEARGDQIQVQFLPFEVGYAAVDEVVEASALDSALAIGRLHGRTALGLVVALLAYMLFLRPIKKHALAALEAAKAPRQLAAAPTARGAAPAQVSQAAPALGPAAAAAQGSPAERLADQVNAEVVEEPAVPAAGAKGPSIQELREAVIQNATNDPAATAHLIRGWLQEGRG